MLRRLLPNADRRVFPREVDGFGVDIFADRLRDIGLRWKGQEGGPVGVFQAVVVRDGAHGLHEARVHARLGTARDRFRHVRDVLEREALRRLPAVEEVAVRADERQHLAIAGRGVELNGRGEVAQHGQHGTLADIFEGEDFLLLPEHDQAVPAEACHSRSAAGLRHRRRAGRA